MVEQLEVDEKKEREIARYAYPYYDLETCIEVVRVLHNQAGGKASLAQLASYLGNKDEFSGAFRAKVWGAKLFGLVEIVENSASVTRLGEELASSRAGVQRDKRLAEAFLNVPLFKEIYRKYQNTTLPSTRDGLKQALRNTFGVPEGRISTALKTFEASAEQAGFKRGDANRMIHPVPAGLIERELPHEPEPEEQKVKPVGLPEQLSSTVHPAISGFLQELPSKDKKWTEGERQRWIEAFTAIVKALYPTAEEN